MAPKTAQGEMDWQALANQVTDAALDLARHEMILFFSNEVCMKVGVSLYMTAVTGAYPYPLVATDKWVDFYPVILSSCRKQTHREASGSIVRTRR